MVVLASLVVVGTARPSRAEQGGMAAGKTMEQAIFGGVPGLPTCMTGAVESGDPTKGASIILGKGEKGCVIPWHWHTPIESVMMVSGSARMEMKDGSAANLKAGGFAEMPSHHVHQFTCTSACVLFIHSDGAFDMHYVDGQGKDLTPDEALKKVKETPAKPPQS